MIYEVTINYLTIDKNGNEKSVKEIYLTADGECEDFGSAEDVAYVAFKNLSCIDVIAIKRSRLKEILNQRTGETQEIYIAEVADLQNNADGEAVEVVYKVAMFADSLDAAYAFTKQYMAQGYGMSIVGIKKTKIKDVI